MTVGFLKKSVSKYANTVCLITVSLRASLIAQLVKNQETPILFLGWEICWRRDRLPTPIFLGFSCGSADKESTCIVGDLGSIPGLERSSGEGKGYPLQYSGLENFMDYKPWDRKESDMTEQLSRSSLR